MLSNGRHYNPDLAHSCRSRPLKTQERKMRDRKSDGSNEFVLALSTDFSTTIIGPILWGHSGPLCHALSLLLLLLLSLMSLWISILQCHSPGVATVACRLRYSYSWLRLILVVVSTVANGEWQRKIRTGGVRRLTVANGPNIFQMLLVRDFRLGFSSSAL